MSIHLEELLASLAFQSSTHDYLSYTVYLLSEIQTLALLFNFQFSFSQSSEASQISFIKDLSSFFSLSFISQTPTLEISIQMVFALIICVAPILSILVIFANKSLKMEKLDHLARNLLRSLQFCSQNILCVSVVGNFIKLIKAYLDGNILLYGIDNSLGFFILAVIIFFVFLITTITFSFFSYHGFEGRNWISCKDSAHYQLGMIQKMANVSLFIIDPNGQNFKFVFVVFNALIVGGKLNELISFYKYPILKLKAYFIALEISISGLSLISVISRLDGFVYLPISAILLSMCVNFFIRKYLDSELFGTPNTFNQPKSLKKNFKEFFKHFVGISHILNNGLVLDQESENIKTREEILYMGILSKHAKRCEEKACICKTIIFDNSSSIKFSEISKEILLCNFNIRKDLFNSYLDANKFDNNILLFYVQNIVEKFPQKFLLAFSLLCQVKLEKLSLINRIKSKFLLEKVIQISTIESNVEYVDVKGFMDYNNHASKIQNLMMKNCKKSLDFWNMFKQNKIEVAEIVKMSNQVESQHKKISKKWEILQETYKTFCPNLNVTMIAYDSIIRNSECSRKSFLKNKERTLQKYYKKTILPLIISNETLIDQKNIQICISMSKESLGTITNISENIEAVYGLIKEEAIGQNIKIIIPSFLKEHHQKFLFDHIEKGTTSRMNKNLLIYGESIDGFLVPQRMYITPYIDPKYGFSYFGILRPILKEMKVILVLENGDIAGLTKEIRRSLNYLDKNIRLANLNHLCPEFEIVNKKLNLYFFLEYLNIDKPIWLLEDINQQKVKLEGISHEFFKKYPGELKNIIIPQSQSEFYDIIREIKGILADGFNLEFNLDLYQCKKFKTKFEIETLKTGQIIKYLNMEEIYSLEENLEEPIQNFDDLTEIPNELLTTHTQVFQNSTLYLETNFKTSNYHSQKSENEPHKILPLKNIFLNEEHKTSLSINFENYAPKQNEELRTKRLELIEQISMGPPNAQIKAFSKNSDDIDSESHSSNSKNQISLRFEQILQEETIHNGRKIINFLLISFILLSSLLVLIQSLYINSELSQIQFSYNLRYLTALRKMEVLHTEISTEFLILSILGILPIDYMGEENLKETIHDHFGESNENLALYSLNIRMNVHQLGMDVENGFMEIQQQKIDLKSPDKQDVELSLNLFEMTNTIITFVEKLLVEDFEEIEIENRNLQYLSLNIAGDFLEQINLDLKFMNDRFDEIQKRIFDFIFKMIIGFGLLSVILFGLNYHEENQEKKRKKKFYRSIFYLNENLIEKQEEKIIEFYKIFKDDLNYDDKYILRQSRKKTFEVKKKQSFKHSKQIIFEGSYTKLVKRSLVVFIILISSPLIFFVFYTRFSNLNSWLEMNSASLILLEDQIFACTFLFGALFQYFRDDNSETIGKGVEQAIQDELFLLKNNQGNLVNEIQKFQGNSFAKILFDDLCETVAEDAKRCYENDQNSASKGFIHLNSFVISVIENAVRTYSKSNMTTEDKALVLNDEQFVKVLILFEEIYEGLLKELNENQMSDTEIFVEEYKGKFWTLSIGFILFYILLILLGKTFVINEAEEEGRESKRLLKLIPLKMIMENKILYQNLFKSESSILGCHSQDVNLFH